MPATISSSKTATMKAKNERAVLADTVNVLCRRITTLLERYSANPERRIVIGLAGVPGSGKSTMSSAVIDALRLQSVTEVAVVSMDGFHYPKSVLSTFDDPKTAFQRRGAPWTFDANAFVQLIVSLKMSPVTSLDEPTLALRAPSFDHAIQDPVQDDIYISSSNKVVILEGNYLLLDEAPWRKIAPMLDESWFVDIPPEVAQHRLIQRHLRAGIEETWEAAAARVDENDTLNGELIRAKLIKPDFTMTN